MRNLPSDFPSSICDFRMSVARPSPLRSSTQSFRWDFPTSARCRPDKSSTCL